jgi:hypothetical protein
MQLNGTKVTDLDQFQHDLESFRKDHPGDVVVLVVDRLRRGEETIKIEPPQSEPTTPTPGGLPGADQ